MLRESESSWRGKNDLRSTVFRRATLREYTLQPTIPLESLTVKNLAATVYPESFKVAM